MNIKAEEYCEECFEEINWLLVKQSEIREKQTLPSVPRIIQ